MKRSLMLAVACANVVLASAGLAALGADAGEDVSRRNEDARQVAEAWFTSLMTGRTAVTTSLSAVPFSFDRKQTVESLTDLRNLYDQIVAKQGKRDLKPTAVKIESSSSKNVEVVVMIEDEGVVVSVKPGEAFRVVGFWD
jgi:hypothetical protein